MVATGMRREDWGVRTPVTGEVGRPVSRNRCHDDVPACKEEDRVHGLYWGLLGRGSARSTWGLDGGGGDMQAGPGGMVSRVAQTRRRLACPGPVLGGEIPLSQGTGPCPLQWGKDSPQWSQREWACLPWTW